MSCAEIAASINLPFVLWTWVGRRKHKFNRIRQVAPMCTISIVFARWKHKFNRICQMVLGTTWRIWLNHPSVAAMRSYVKLLWLLVVTGDCWNDCVQVRWPFWRPIQFPMYLQTGTTQTSRSQITTSFSIVHTWAKVTTVTQRNNLSYKCVLYGLPLYSTSI